MTITTNGSTQAPALSVSTVGPTEIVGVLTAVGGLLAALFGKDWGISAHAEQIVSAGFLIGPVVIGLARAIKHNGVSKANAQILVAHMYAQSQAAQTANTMTINAVPNAPAPVAATPDAALAQEDGTVDLTDIPQDLPSPSAG